MPQVLSDAYLTEAGGAIVSDLNDNLPYVALFQNNITPTRATVLGDLTECDFSGYSRERPAAWSGVGLAAHVYTYGGDPATFTRGVGATSNTVYGYMVIDSSGTSLLWCEVFAGGPVVMDTPGIPIIVTPRQSYESKYP